MANQTNPRNDSTPASGRPHRSRRNRSQKKPNLPPEKPKKYALAIYDNVTSAKADLNSLQSKMKQCDRLNLVFRTEGEVDKGPFIDLGDVRIYSGSAWATVHERRVEDGWYEEIH